MTCSWPAAVVLCLQATVAAAQTLDLTDPATSAVVPRDQEATLLVENRPVVVLRARVLNRLPADRVASARRVIDQLVSRGSVGPVTTRSMYGAWIVAVAGEDVLAIVPADLDVLEGESLEGAATAAAGRLTTALQEASEARSPRMLIRGVVASVAMTALLWGLLWGVLRVGRVATRRLMRATQRRIGETWRIVSMVNVPRLAIFAMKIVEAMTAALLLYLWLAFVLRRFPYTRPWGESLRSTLIAQVQAGAKTVAAALPGLLTVLVVLVITRAVVKGVGIIFDAVERGRMTLPGVYPDTAVAARRLVTATLWLLALAMAYPYVPGSESSAFKGLSLFVGVVVSIGSSGVMQHLMSGLMLTFARAIHVGDFARIGDVTGTVVQVGALATKIRTPYGEEVTMPNAVVVSQSMINYSAAGDGGVPLLTTSVTIGYDTPWRQVEGLLLQAAHEAGGVRAEPRPFVWRESLEDFYIKYTLLVAPEDPCHRAALLDRLHVHILDAFNQYGVQIMSPHYMVDPRDQKVVAPSRWHQPPAVDAVVTAAVPDPARRS